MTPIGFGERWGRFIHTHHYDYYTDYFQSSLAYYPRRTGESFMHEMLPTTLSEALQEPNRVPNHFDTMEEMWMWFRPLIEAENEQLSGVSGKIKIPKNGKIKFPTLAG